jgi:hypothetical protein
MKNYDDLIGKRFNRMTLNGVFEVPGGYTEGEFTCDCGTVKRLRLHAVTTGNTKSCGCFKRQRVREVSVTHGGTGTPEYRSYYEMRKRCLNPRNHAYDRYGGRGITICDRWLSGFENFRADMGPRPSPRHSLDRIDNHGPYSPDNCRWATGEEQCNNRRSTRLLTAEGRTMGLKEWCEELGVSRYLMVTRMDAGMAAEEVVADFRRTSRAALASK